MKRERTSLWAATARFARIGKGSREPGPRSDVCRLLGSAASIMSDQNDQRGLPSGNDDLPEEPHHWDGVERRTITPGDWLSIEHEGRTVVGMLYRRQDDAYMFVYWENLVLRFGTTTRDRIGSWDEELTAIFRGQIAVIPNYVEKCIAAWVMQPEQPVRTKRSTTLPATNRGEPPKVQKRLFPE
jgi:hypothetical protein